MAHEIEMINGKAQMFFRGETPWHKLGTAVNGNLTVEQAIQTAGLNWEVGMKPLQTTDGIGVAHKAVYRKTDSSILGIVGPSYNPLQNSEAFAWFNPFVESGVASFECAGSLNGGRKVWILAKINIDNQEVVAGDPVSAYILLSNSHDGTLAARAGFTPVRVVCNNTLSAAHTTFASKLLRVNHTKNIVTNLEKIQETMDVATRTFNATVEQYKTLAKRGINTADLEKYVNIVFRAQSKVDEFEAVETRKSKVLEDVTNLFETGRGSDIAEVRGTLWGAYNAITEYIQYNRGKDESKRLNETWFGGGMVLNNKALKTALDMTAV